MKQNSMWSTAALMTRKNWANNTSKWMVRGGSKVWAFGDEAVGQTGGQTHLLGRHVLGRHASRHSKFQFGGINKKNCIRKKDVSEKPISEKPVLEDLYLKNLFLKNLYLKNLYLQNLFLKSLCYVGTRLWLSTRQLKNQYLSKTLAQWGKTWVTAHLQHIR